MAPPRTCSTVGAAVRPGLYLFVADDVGPAYVETVHRGLTAAGLHPTLDRGYREYYNNSVRNRPDFAGFPRTPTQTWVLVIGRTEAEGSAP